MSQLAITISFIAAILIIGQLNSFTYNGVGFVCNGIILPLDYSLIMAFKTNMIITTKTRDQIMTSISSEIDWNNYLYIVIIILRNECQLVDML